MTILVIYVTFPGMEEAKSIGNKLLKNKLIACANYHSLTSEYIWEGQVTSDNEVAASFKTLLHLESEVRQLIEKDHSYEVPLIGSHEMKVNPAYFEWMTEVCK